MNAFQHGLRKRDNDIIDHLVGQDVRPVENGRCHFGATKALNSMYKLTSFSAQRQLRQTLAWIELRGIELRIR